MTSPAVDEKAATPATTVTVLHHPDVKQTAVESLSPLPEGDSHRPSEASTPCSQNELNPFDTDVEAMIISTRTTNDDCGMKSIKCTQATAPADCQVWPGQDHWKRKAKAAKLNQRSCPPLAKLSKRNRIIVKVLIAALVIGVAVGVGIGISIAVGAPWKTTN